MPMKPKLPDMVPSLKMIVFPEAFFAAMPVIPFSWPTRSICCTAILLLDAVSVPPLGFI